jgi:DNA repair exonuclease SbcCD nuclease subunit
MRMIRFIGDTHAKFLEYKTILPEFESVVVGDFGIGFGVNPISVSNTKDKFIRGNHDNPELCKKQHNWIPDGHVDGKIFYVGGARSTDIAMRIEGKSWWPEEELSMPEFYQIMDTYEQAKPAIVVSHDAPDPINHYILGYHNWDMSRTNQKLGSMFYLHKPKLWLFGHHHKRFNMEMDGCQFVCIPELGHIDIDVDSF